MQAAKPRQLSSCEETTVNLALLTTSENRWDEKAGLRRDAVRSQVIDVLEAQIKRRPAGCPTFRGLRKVGIEAWRTEVLGLMRSAEQGEGNTRYRGLHRAHPSKIAKGGAAIVF